MVRKFTAVFSLSSALPWSSASSSPSPAPPPRQRMPSRCFLPAEFQVSPGARTGFGQRDPGERPGSRGRRGNHRFLILPWLMIRPAGK